MKTKAYVAPRMPLPTPPLIAATSAHKAITISTLFRRIALFVFIGVVYGIFKNICTMSSMDIDLLQYTDSIFIPFVYKFSTKHVPQVMCTIEGVDIKMPVDTGSTGLLIGAPILPNISVTIGTPAHHFFTSSKILYIGRLVELPLGFHGESGSYATTTVPVLIVDKSWRCPWYNPSKDRFECPVGPTGEKATERDTSNITYMGVGHGRNHPRDGMPYAAPKVNPFLNIDAIDGSPVSKSSMRTGYVISAEGVHLGLTPHNTRDFAFQKLEPGLTHAADPRDWAMAKMCFSIDGQGRSCGAGLVDTGIPQMYIRAEEGVSIPNVTIRNPNGNGHTKMVKRVTPGTNITVGFPSLNALSMCYSFVVGEGSSIEPSYVVPVKKPSPPFVNTGRNLLFGHSITFDAIGGRFGIRTINSSARSSSLLE